MLAAAASFARLLSRSRAGDSATSHTEFFAACRRSSRPPAVSRWSLGESACGRATATAFHPAQLQRSPCWRTAASLWRLFSWHIATLLQLPLLSPRPLFPWFTLSTGGCSATAVRLLLSQAVSHRRLPLPPSLFLAGTPGLPAATRGSTRGRSPHPPMGLHFFPGLPGGLWL